MKKAISFITLAIVCVFVLGIGHKVPNVVTRHMPITPSVVHAQEGCSVATLQGEYLVTGEQIIPVVNLTPHSPA
jgi:hypothetical protein